MKTVEKCAAGEKKIQLSRALQFFIFIVLVRNPTGKSSFSEFSTGKFVISESQPGKTHCLEAQGISLIGIGQVVLSSVREVVRSGVPDQIKVANICSSPSVLTIRCWKFWVLVSTINSIWVLVSTTKHIWSSESRLAINLWFLRFGYSLPWIRSNEWMRKVKLSIHHVALLCGQTHSAWGIHFICRWYTWYAHSQFGTVGS